MRVWKEIYLPVFEIINSLLVGFLFLATLHLMVESSNESILIWNNYPKLFVLSIVSTVVGYILIGFLGKESIHKATRLGSLGLLICLIWLFWILNRPILVESIFFQKSFDSLIIGISLMAGILLADQKEVQKGGFLIGILIYFLSEDVLDWHLEHLKILICLYGITLLINYGFRNILEIKNQFLPTRIVKKKFKYFQPVYHSFLILFILMVGSQIYRGLAHIDLLIVLYLISYSLTRSFVIYKISGQIHRLGFIYGRYLLTISFICFSAIFSWSILIYPLVVMIAVGLAFFKPTYSTENNDSNAILLGALTILIAAIIIYLSKSNIYFIHLSALLYLIVFFPIFKKTMINPIDKIIPVAIGLLFSIFLFQVPTRVNTNTNRFEPIPIFDPIPYQLSDLFDSDEKYSYIRSNLPFVSRVQFPQEEEIEGTVPILGYNPDDIYLHYYSDFLREKQIPFYVIATNTQIRDRKNINMLEQLEFVDYPGFKIFFPPNAKKPSWTNRLSRDWKFGYMQDKVGSLSNWDQVSLEFSTIEKYASSDLKTEMRNYRRLIHDSISQYCMFYFNNQRFLDTLECSSLALKFGELDPSMKSISYQSLNYTTPNLNHIEVLRNLSIDPEFRVSSLKKLFPIYDSLGDYKNTIDTIGQLKLTLEKNEAYHELNELEIDEARMYLKLGKWEEANSAITQGQRKNPDSILWQRLYTELEKWKQQRNKSWSNQPDQNSKGI